MSEAVKSDTTRRRGRELEDALLEAAWDELVAVGYGAFTIEAVAERAKTSRPVLYRRWPNRADLAIAAVRHHGWIEPVTTPDTDSVRDDLVALLRDASERRSDMAAMFSVLMGQFFTETGRTPADIRTELLGGKQGPWAMDEILRRGVDRGEIDPAKLTPRIATLPADLLRHELLMTLRPVPESTIAEIIDDIFMPLVRPA